MRPLVVDNGMSQRRSTRETKAPRKLSFDISQPDREWSDATFAQACAAEVNVEIDLSGSDASIFVPTPANLR